MNLSYFYEKCNIAALMHFILINKEVFSFFLRLIFIYTTPIFMRKRKKNDKKMTVLQKRKRIKAEREEREID